MKNIMLTLSMFCAICTLAAPPPPRGHHPGPGPSHRPSPSHHSRPPSHHHSSGHYWSGFAGGVLGGLIGTALKPDPVVVVPAPVVTTPVVVTPTPQPTVIVQGISSPKQVWQEGHYESRVQPNGTMMTVWVPGRFITVP